MHNLKNMCSQHTNFSGRVIIMNLHHEVSRPAVWFAQRWANVLWEHFTFNMCKMLDNLNLAKLWLNLQII